MLQVSMITAMIGGMDNMFNYPTNNDNWQSNHLPKQKEKKKKYKGKKLSRRLRKKLR